MTREEYQTLLFELLEQEGLDDDIAYRIAAEVIGPLYYQIEHDQNKINNIPDQHVEAMR